MKKAEKEILIMGGLLVVMMAKILIIARLIHLWKLQAEAEGRPFGDAEERRGSSRRAE